jgi:hypothetical protein
VVRHDAPAYLDKTIANTIHAALALPTSVGSVRLRRLDPLGHAAILGAGTMGGLAVLSDIRTGFPAARTSRTAATPRRSGVRRRRDVIAEPIGGAFASSEFVDRWRCPASRARSSGRSASASTRTRRSSSRRWTTR